jgi:serine/threonine protein kinase
MERGISSLADIIIEMRRQQKFVSFFDFKIIFKSLVTTLHKMHVRKLPHEHLKPSNIIQMSEEEYYVSDVSHFSVDLKDMDYNQYSAI